jgi:hypothetical protein
MTRQTPKPRKNWQEVQRNYHLLLKSTSMKTIKKNMVRPPTGKWFVFRCVGPVGGVFQQKQKESKKFSLFQKMNSGNETQKPVVDGLS